MAGARRICVIDLGTNSFHSIIADVHLDRGFTVVDKLKEPVALGEAGRGARALTSDAVGRAETALKRIKTLADRRGADQIIALATSAIREATNGDAFIAHIRATLGIDIEPIPGEREAELIYRGVRRVVDLTQPALIVDIGGGSTELVVASADEIFIACSLRLGAARLSQRFVSSDPLSSSDLEALRDHLAGALEPALRECGEHGIGDLVGCSGAIENLVAAAMERTSRTGHPDQHVFTSEEILAVTREVIAADRAGRLEMSSIDRRRIDQIPAAAVLLEALIEDGGIERVRVSPAALREGVVEEYLERNGEVIRQIGDEPDVLLRRARELAIRHGRDPEHAARVTAVACDLFDELEPLHLLGGESRRLLEAAALVHDVGHTISGRRHHKHSRYIIEQSDWPGVEPEDVEIIACVARYHRRARPKKRHRRFRDLPKRDRFRVRALAAILRLADKLDRSHIGNTESIRVDIGAETVQLTIETRGDPELELRAARRAVAAFEKAFKRDLEIHAAWQPGSSREASM